jgi:pimeloyl-ACP methyl ester carboxylesterase
MGKRELKATLGFAAAALLLGSCGLSAGDGTAGPFALLGPPEAQVNLYYEEQGKGPPVLLLHGFGASTFTWRHIAPELAQTHRVIAVDLKGFGQSDKPFDERYSVSDQAELLAQLIEDKDLRDLTIVGHSFGGGVALRLALEANARLQGRISRLVLLDSIAYQQQIPVFFRLLDVPLVSQVGVRMVPPSVDRLSRRQQDRSRGSRDLRRAAQDRGRKARDRPERAADRAPRHRFPPRSLQVDYAADTDLVVRPRPHRAARDRHQAPAHSAQLHVAAGRGLRTHAAGGAAESND